MSARQIQDLPEAEEMAKAPSVQDRLADLSRLGKAPDSPEAREQLRKHLASKISLIAAKAAEIVAHLETSEFVPDLAAAFHRFMIDPAKTDKGCAAKTAIVKALLAAECDEEAIFKIGVRHVQMEPTWGGRMDTAAPLRALSGLGLVQVGSPEAMNELATLLADVEADARIGAARALANRGSPAVPLLRFKALTGDQSPAVLAECFSGLMTLAPRESIEFVAGFVDRGHPLVYEHAALALGESRLPEVFEILKEKWNTTFDREFRQTLLLPIALTRSEAACDFLISVLESGELRLATAALAALAIYRGDPHIRGRAEEAIGGPNRAQLLATLRDVFE